MLIYYKGKEHHWDVGVELVTATYNGYIVRVDEKHLDNFDYAIADASVELTEEEYEFGLANVGKTQLSYWVDDNENEYSTYDASLPGITKVKRDFTESEIDVILSFIKKVAIVTAQQKYGAKFNALKAAEFEMGTWEQQKAEAAAGEGPLIEALATARGITLAEMIAKIEAKIDSYNTAIAAILGDYQAVKDEINGVTELADVETVILTKMGFDGSINGTLNM